MQVPARANFLGDGTMYRHILPALGCRSTAAAWRPGRTQVGCLGSQNLECVVGMGIAARQRRAKQVRQGVTQADDPMLEAFELGLGLFGHPSASDTYHCIEVRNTQLQSVFKLLHRVAGQLAKGLRRNHPSLACKFTHRGFGIAPRRVPLTDHQQWALGVAHKIGELKVQLLDS